MQKIGVIRVVQIQTGKLKAGEKPERYYDPSHILRVDALLLTHDGVTGLTDDGGRIIDIHNARHPETRNNGTNGISLGFTAHYRRMRERFGARITDGIAGENIIIESDTPFHAEDLQAGLVIESGGQQRRFHYVKIALPCNEFSTFCLTGDRVGSAAASDLKAALQFLDQGTRGFMIAPYPDADGSEVRAGDMVYVLEG